MRKQRGFTLVELVIAISVFALFGTFSVSVLQSALISRNISARSMREQIALRQALLTITREIRKTPEEDDPLYGPVASRYALDGSSLVRRCAAGPGGSYPITDTHSLNTNVAGNVSGVKNTINALMTGENVKELPGGYNVVTPGSLSASHQVIRQREWGTLTLAGDFTDTALLAVIADLNAPLCLGNAAEAFVCDRSGGPPLYIYSNPGWGNSLISFTGGGEIHNAVIAVNNSAAITSVSAEYVYCDAVFHINGEFTMSLDVSKWDITGVPVFSANSISAGITAQNGFSGIFYTPNGGIGLNLNAPYLNGAVLTDGTSGLVLRNEFPGAAVSVGSGAPAKYRYGGAVPSPATIFETEG